MTIGKEIKQRLRTLRIAYYNSALDFQCENTVQLINLLKALCLYKSLIKSNAKIVHRYQRRRDWTYFVCDSEAASSASAHVNQGRFWDHFTIIYSLCYRCPHWLRLVDAYPCALYVCGLLYCTQICSVRPSLPSTALLAIVTLVVSLVLYINSA